MKKLLILLVALFGLSACSTYNQTVQVSDRAYLLIIGDPDGNTLVLDDGKPMQLGSDTSSFSLNGDQATKIEISRGKHIVKITRDNQVVVKRAFYVSTGESFEVRL